MLLISLMVGVSGLFVIFQSFCLCDFLCFCFILIDSFAVFVMEKRTLKAGKLNERVLRLFMASGNEEVLSIIDALKIRIDVTPILPTRKFLVLLLPLFGLYKCS